MLVGVLYERYPEKFRKINSERPALKSIFHKDVGLQHATLSKIGFPVRLAKFFTRAFLQNSSENLQELSIFTCTF